MKKQRSPFLSTRLDWISVEIFTLFVSTIIYAIRKVIMRKIDLQQQAVKLIGQLSTDLRTSARTASL